MLTKQVKASDIKQEWVVVDAEGQPLGRLATQIAHVLRGKHKPTFVPFLDCGTHVIVLNADKVVLTGKKWEKNVYWHTGYIGGIKEMTSKEVLEKHPERLITKAVKGMLPKNKLSNKLLKNMRVYAGSEHPHEAQSPKAMPARLV